MSWNRATNWSRYVEDLERRAALSAEDGGRWADKTVSGSPAEPSAANEDSGRDCNDYSDHGSSGESRKGP